MKLEKLIDEINRKDNITTILSATVAEILGNDEFKGIVIDVNGDKQTLNVDGVFVAIGQQPENEPFENVATLNDYGYIVADESCTIANQTGIFVAGDCRTKTVRQITTATADGAVAALAAVDRIIGNKIGIGKEFERAIEMIAPLALSMAGILILAPTISHLLQGISGYFPDFLDFSIIPSANTVKFNGEFYFTVSFKEIKNFTKRRSNIADKRLQQLKKIISEQEENTSQKEKNVQIEESNGENSEN